MTFCILIPTINRKDLLIEALDFYTTHMPNTQILIWDNGKQAIPTYPNTEIFEAEYNYGVAASWNALIDKAWERGIENYLILNDDVILRCGEGIINQMLVKCAETKAFHRCRPFYNWSAFILRKSTYDLVGRFDENFKRCYFEDNDYQYRMRLAGIPIMYEDQLNPEIYRNSQSILKDPLLSNYIDNRDYFVKKWGGMPDSETHKTPFNE
jgi:GT2 family glycosyltransferase